jgi:hypothetical protein
VMNQQNFTHYPYVMDLIKQVEKLFGEIQKMERCVCMYVCMYVCMWIWLCSYV